MKIKEIHISISEYSDCSELTDTDKKLFGEAQKSILSAYAPYSKYCVGSALLLESGMIVTGSNQENVAYPSGLCAERVALFSARSNYPNQKILALALTSEPFNTSTSLLTPCGGCRQVICEVEENQNAPIRIICGSENDSILIFNSGDQLLPFSFSNPTLKTK